MADKKGMKTGKVRIGCIGCGVWFGRPSGEGTRIGIPSLLQGDFDRAVLEGRQPKTGLRESRVVQKITDAIYASAEKNQTVRINC